MERAYIMCGDDLIELADLPDDIQAERYLSPPEEVAQLEPAPLRDAWMALPWKEVRRHVLEGAELAYLKGVLTETQGRVGDAARHAGVDPRSLFQKMRRYGLRKEDFRPARTDVTAPALRRI